MARAAHPQQPLTAADIMTRNPVVVDITATVQDVADVMFGTEVRHVPVVEQGTLVGMVSDRDLRSYLLPHPEQIIRPDDARARLAANVGMVMRTDMLTVTPENGASPVVGASVSQTDSARPVGLVSTDNDISGATLAMSFLPRARKVLSFASFCPGPSSPVKPAARSRWAITGCSGLSR